MDAHNTALPDTIPDFKGMATSSDVWLTTRARIVLLTTEGITLTDGLIETHNGIVTLRGEVSTYGEQQRAGVAVGAIDGVKGVRNFLKVVGSRPEEKPTDEEIKGRVEEALRKDPSLDGLKVAAVDHGVVRMTGKGVTLTGRLRAIELVWNVPGLASEGETPSPNPTDPTITTVQLKESAK